MSLETIQHQGKNIVLVDYTQCGSLQEQKTLMAHSTKEILAKPDNSVLLMIDFKGQKTSPELTELGKKSVVEINGKLKKATFVGITALQKIILNAINLLSKTEIKALNTREDALNYLVKE